MKSLEVEGKTIDEAIEKACNEFQVSREKLNIEIISEKTSGFLGIVGNKKAKIKATLLSFDEALSGYSATSTPVAASQRPAGSISSAPSREEVPIGPVAEKAKEILDGLLLRMHLDFPVTVEESADQIILNISGNGDGGGLLIGRRGQNLDAIQYIVNKAVHKSANGRKIIVVDTESYRQRREESLVALAAEIGEKVKKTKKAVSLSYLNAHSRRIIHMALQNDASLTTKSRGEGEYRKLIIVPAKKG